jgi:uracil-DNA glycosylase family 4
MSKEYVPAYGPIGAELMILGESPSYQEVAQGKPFVGPSGKELDRLLKDSGIYRDNCWISNVCKYEVPSNGPKEKVPFAVRALNAGINLPEQLAELQNEINQIKPNCILALGGTALWALTGKTKISNFRGSILSGMGRKVVSTYHPAHLLHQSYGGEIKGYWNRQVMIFDFKRAHAQSKFPDLKLPIRHLQICRSSYELAEFLKKYPLDKFPKGAVDIEAGGHCVPICIGLSFNKNHGICVPLWNCDGISTIPDSDLVQMWILLAQRLYDMAVVGQNFNYDRDKILRLGFIIRKLADDTMLKAHAINPELPKGLGFLTSLYTEEPFYKDEGMYEGNLADLFTGCARDACVTLEVNENMDADVDELHMRSFYQNFLMKLPEFYWGIERQGFHVDPDERDRLIRKYIEWDEKVRFRLYQLTGTEINVNSPKQIGILLWDNLKLPRKDSTGEEDITALLNSPTAIKNEEDREICELILEDRRVRKSISTYLMALPDFDGRMRTTYFPCLDTGRSSTGQQDPPIRPQIEVIDENGKKKKKVLGTAFQTMTKHGDIGADIRGMYVPDPAPIIEGVDPQLLEEVFVQADSEQAEARVVWLLANDEEALRLVDEIDYHALTATWFFGNNKEFLDYDKKKLGYEHPIRFAGKTLRHAGHLGAGKRRASIEVNTQARKYKIPIHISEQIAERALKIFHAKQPKIQQVFQAQVIECLKKNRMLIAPLPYGVDAEIGGVRIFYERFGEELFRQGFSYIPQRAVTDNTKAAGMRIKNCAALALRLLWNLMTPSCSVCLDTECVNGFQLLRKNLSDLLISLNALSRGEN